MRLSILFAALVALSFASTSLSAAEISRSELCQIGLPGLKMMSHQQAMQIRGTGAFIYLSGYAYASVLRCPL